MNTATKPKPNRRKPLPPHPAPTDIRAILARALDRAADHQLHLGYHYQAERLSRQADELRGAA